MHASARGLVRAERWAVVHGVPLSGDALDRLAARLAARRRIRVVVTAASLAAFAVFVWRAPTGVDTTRFAWVLSGVAVVGLAADAAAGLWRTRAERRISASPRTRVAPATRTGLGDALGTVTTALVAVTVAGWSVAVVVAAVAAPVEVTVAWATVVAAAIAHAATAVHRLGATPSSAATAGEIAADEVLRRADARDHLGNAIVAPATCGGVVAGSVGVAHGPAAGVAMAVLCAGPACLTLLRMGSGGAR